MKYALSTRLKTNKTRSEIANIGLRELQKHSGTSAIARDGSIVGQVKCGDLVMNKFRLSVTELSGGYSLDIQVDRGPSIYAIVMLTLCGLLSCFLIPLVVFIFLLVKTGSTVRDPNATPLNQVLENIKAECEL